MTPRKDEEQDKGLQHDELCCVQELGLGKRLLEREAVLREQLRLLCAEVGEDLEYVR
jgi:hypothetical protein